MNLLRLPSGLILLIFTLCWQSCQLDSLAEYQPLIYEGQDYLDNHETPPFLYHYEEKNTETEYNRGWIIDNEGLLRKYQNVHIRMYDTNNTASMRAFVERTEVVKQLDVNQLVRLYKKNLKISEIAPVVTEMEAKKPMTYTYFGYTLSYPDEHGNNCGARRQVGYFARITLESKGKLYVRTENSAARAVLSYLKMIAKSEIQ